MGRSTSLFDADGIRLQQDLNAILAQNFGYRIRYVGILAAQQPLASLHDRDPAAEAPEHLAEFQSDVPPAQHQQMFRYGIELHDRGGVEGRHNLQARQRR